MQFPSHKSSAVSLDENYGPALLTLALPPNQCPNVASQCDFITKAQRNNSGVFSYYKEIVIQHSTVASKFVPLKADILSSV